MKKRSILFIIAVCAVALAAVCTGCTIAVNSGKDLQGRTVNAETSEVDRENPDPGTVSGTAASIVSGTAARKSTYTEDELCEAAINYYSTLNGYTPRYCDASYEGDEVTLHLYDIVRDHTATSAWYTVNIYTGKGVDFFDNAVDIMHPPIIEKDNG